MLQTSLLLMQSINKIVAPIFYDGQSESSVNGPITFLSIILRYEIFTHWSFYTSQIKLRQERSRASYYFTLTSRHLHVLGTSWPW